MSQVEQTHEVPRAQMIAIRRARRYLKTNAGTLARVLNAYKSAARNGTQRGYLAER
ncbi:hypothetical protein [Planktotalea arctica]|uniref:hypothetical protein n=1 Tax=Planktotalea arctica TaxID=1481893 RepID=UPI001594A979|nr:hypothetical protein [Planktotalea arctica]